MGTGSTRHQLLQPVMAILGFVQLLRDNWEQLTQEQRAKYLDVLERQGERLAVLISSLPADLPPLDVPLEDEDDLG